LSKLSNRTLLSLALNLGVVFIFVVPFSLLLFSLDYDRGLIIAFSISNLLLLTDGFLTVYALDKGATEFNPLMNLLSKITNRKTFLVVSRLIGSLFTLYGGSRKKSNLPLDNCVDFLDRFMSEFNDIIIQNFFEQKEAKNSKSTKDEHPNLPRYFRYHTNYRHSKTVSPSPSTCPPI